MRHPWQHGANAADELEALQTDVMRFIAILGLCLVAIFSLVNGVQQEQVIVQQQPTPAPEVKLESVPAVSLPAAPEPPAAQPPVESPRPEPDRSGFTLEFESGDALRSLLAGGHVQLLAVVDGDFNRYHADGVFRQAEAPASYYQMDAATVPRRLRLQAASLDSGSVSWGVVLPATAVSDIQRLVSSGAGGQLLIGSDAGVRLVGND